MSHNASPLNHIFEPCLCGHQRASHDDKGCLVCAAQGNHCPEFWAQADYDDAVQTGLDVILKAKRSRKEQAK